MDNRITRVAAIQMVSGGDVQANLASAAGLIQRAAAERATFMLLPENFALMGGREEDKLLIMEPYGSGPIQNFLAAQAQQHVIWLMGGTIPLTAKKVNKVRAACLLYNPAGECVARYDKIHLFDVAVGSGAQDIYNESVTIEGGTDITVADMPFGNIGMSVCYDVRFPELFRRMHQDHVHIITVPSAFTATTGKAHWETLMRARAIENLCYVIASNQGGRHVNGRETWGHSMVVNPWGEVLAVVEQGDGIACADIDLEQLRALRNRFPTLTHRKIN
ncbi:MAG: carbon-nitrogen hydrolase family protein [Gammaproteobacteria bacterium]